MAAVAVEVFMAVAGIGNRSFELLLVSRSW